MSRPGSTVAIHGRQPTLELGVLHVAHGRHLVQARGRRSIQALFLLVWDELGRQADRGERRGRPRAAATEPRVVHPHKMAQGLHRRGRTSPQARPLTARWVGPPVGVDAGAGADRALSLPRGSRANPLVAGGFGTRWLLRERPSATCPCRRCPGQGAAYTVRAWNIRRSERFSVLTSLCPGPRIHARVPEHPDRSRARRAGARRGQQVLSTSRNSSQAPSPEPGARCSYKYCHGDWHPHRTSRSSYEKSDDSPRQYEYGACNRKDPGELRNQQPPRGTIGHIPAPFAHAASHPRHQSRHDRAA